jgi:flagellin
MGFSVNTNVGAMAALQSINETSRSLASTQTRINTGLNVASTKDDSASYTIAQKLRGDVAGLRSVNSSLARAKSVTDTAVAGAEQISDLINQMRAKAYEASDTGVDADSRTAIANDFDALKAQIETVIESSTFNGTNLLKTGGGNVAALQSLDTSAATLDVANLGFDTSVTTAIGTTFTDAATAKTMIGTLDSIAGTLKTDLSTLGSASRKIEGQMTFSSKLSDVIQSGVGNLVDADLAKESASLQALQVKQQLGLQALSIANQAPQSILSLFR